ncbi:hypothetical protein GALMADRAFT_720674 [Galerina marginata CBS 339.88]|uniref:Uncharacterized protein n=1 Tax=Galerina marginata (strain CBS 339.88) TaxID=685588 RepID=A0A067TXG0_GALM3|nr:hypothetical protein GALMADRAFT_720653 [Galerina marginata CBS 339.88]KDR84682.1 hypothetical protein GALMADRAFT_720674 [Galerina marginata CBS 339.88]
MQSLSRLGHNNETKISRVENKVLEHIRKLVAFQAANRTSGSRIHGEGLKNKCKSTIL